MKIVKLLSVVALSAMTLAASAAVTGKAKIVISSVGGGSDELILLEGSEYTAAYENGADAEKLMNTGQNYNINLYAVGAGKNLSMICTNDLAETPIVFQSNKTETEYTMTFSKVAGTIELFDAVANQRVVLANAGTYVFTCAANTTIADRFIINHAAPAEPAICHQYGNLIITGHQGAKVKVLDMADQVAIAEQTLATDDETISLSSLTKGDMYQVIVDDAAPMLIRIQ